MFHVDVAPAHSAIHPAVDSAVVEASAIAAMQAQPIPAEWLTQAAAMPATSAQRGQQQTRAMVVAAVQADSAVAAAHAGSLVDAASSVVTIEVTTAQSHRVTSVVAPSCTVTITMPEVALYTTPAGTMAGRWAAVQCAAVQCAAVPEEVTAADCFPVCSASSVEETAAVADKAAGCLVETLAVETLPAGAAVCSRVAGYVVEEIAAVADSLMSMLAATME